MARNYASVLKHLRQRAGYSQKEEADKLGDYGIIVNNAHISRWESGANNPTIEQLIGICRLYNIKNVRDIFGDIVMDSLTRDLNDQGVAKILEYHDLLVEDPYYTINPGVYGPNTFAENFAENEAAFFGDNEPPEDLTNRVPLYELPGEDPTTSQSNQFAIIPGDLLDEEIAYAVSTRDDAMSPEINFGEPVFIMQGSKPQNGDIILVRFNGNLFLRKYVREQKNDWLLALNKAYRALRITPRDRVNVLGIAVGHDRPS